MIVKTGKRDVELKFGDPGSIEIRNQMRQRQWCMYSRGVEMWGEPAFGSEVCSHCVWPMKMHCVHGVKAADDCEICDA